MSHFYGTLEGQAGEATRRGSKNSGLTTHAASWQGAVRVPWRGGGTSRLLYEGPINGKTQDAGQFEVGAALRDKREGKS